jgi:outer membrane protease
MHIVTIELPDSIEITGAKGAPENLRVVSTVNWGSDFCFAALKRGVSQKIGDTWSVSKKDVTKTAATHKAMEEGDWNQREQTGASAQKFDEAIKKLNIQALAGKLTREQLAALAAVITPDGEVKF